MEIDTGASSLIMVHLHSGYWCINPKPPPPPPLRSRNCPSPSPFLDNPPSYILIFQDAPTLKVRSFSESQKY